MNVGTPDRGASVRRAPAFARARSYVRSKTAPRCRASSARAIAPSSTSSALTSFLRRHSRVATASHAAMVARSDDADAMRLSPPAALYGDADRVAVTARQARPGSTGALPEVRTEE